MTTDRRFGYTVIDAIVTLAFAGLAFGLLLPLVQKARAADARAKCERNLQQVGRGVQEYAAGHDGRLPHNVVTTPYASWNTQLLPYIGREELFRKYVPADNWSDPNSANREVAATRVGTFLCPAGPNPDRAVLTRSADPDLEPFRAAATDYVGSAGAYYESNDQKNLHPGAMHHRTIVRRIRLADIQDGTSHTLFVVEMADKPNHWRGGELAEDRLDKPQNPALSGQWAAPNWNHLRSHSTDGLTQFGPCAVNCSNSAAIYGFHPGGANALFVDGSVRLLKAGLSQEMLIALVTYAGGEVLSPNDF